MANYIDIKLYNISESVAGLPETVGYYDIDIDSSGDLVKEEGFNTNLIMSLFCERRASKDEVVNPIARRGWWGNTLNDDKFEFGSKLWLLDQSRLTTATVNMAQQYSLKGVEWLKTDGFIKDLQVTATPTYTASSPSISIQLTLIRRDNAVEYKYFDVWNKTT